jgi:hypothetical protein
VAWPSVAIYRTSYNAEILAEIPVRRFERSYLPVRGAKGHYVACIPRE